MSVQLEAHPQGVVLPVRAQPGGRVNAVRGVHAGMLKVSVTQVAEKGKANQAILATLCEQLDLRRAQVELLSGETSAQKKFLVRELSLNELAAKIETALNHETKED